MFVFLKQLQANSLNILNEQKCMRIKTGIKSVFKIDLKSNKVSTLIIEELFTFFKIHYDASMIMHLKEKLMLLFGILTF